MRGASLERLHLRGYSRYCNVEETLHHRMRTNVPMTAQINEAVSGIRRAGSFATDPDAIAEELHQALAQDDLRLVLVFVSADHDLDALGPALQDRFGPVPVVGCTTAGEITPMGYLRGAACAVGFAGPHFAAAIRTIETLETVNLNRGHELVRSAIQELVRTSPSATRERMFAITLIDGLSGLEEGVVSALHAALGEIPLSGGSAGDSLRFQRTCILSDGRFRSDAALLILIATDHPFRVFKTEHFVAGTEKTVVTEADPARRIVTEINAEPAAREYARLVGLEIDALTPMIFATHPVVVRVGGQNFVRSIQKVNEDESLTFFCAIDEGIVLTAAKGVDLLDNLHQTFEAVRADIGPPAVVIGFDCILRALEMDEKAIRDDVGAMMRAHNVIGFSTFGEQFQAMHVNQTFAGIAIGRRTDA